MKMFFSLTNSGVPRRLSEGPIGDVRHNYPKQAHPDSNKPGVISHFRRLEILKLVCRLYMKHRQIAMEQFLVVVTAIRSRGG